MEGWEAEPSDVLNAVAGVANVRDPLERFDRASAELVLHRAIADQLTAIRERALAELHAAGASYGRLSELTGLSRARVQKIVEAGRGLTD